MQLGRWRRVRGFACSCRVVPGRGARGDGGPDGDLDFLVVRGRVERGRWPRWSELRAAHCHHSAFRSTWWSSRQQASRRRSVEPDDEEHRVLGRAELVVAEVADVRAERGHRRRRCVSHMTRVGSSVMWTSGWKLAGGVERDVGQMTTVESPSRSSAWITTAKREPCWTRPRPPGIVIAWTSPRTTQLLHHRRNLARLVDVCGVAHQRARFGSEAGAPALALGCLCDGLTSGLRSCDPATAGKLVERSCASRPSLGDTRQGGWHGLTVAH